MTLYWHLAAFVFYKDSSVVVCKAVSTIPLVKVLQFDFHLRPILGRGPNSWDLFLEHMQFVENVFILVGCITDQYASCIRNW